MKDKKTEFWVELIKHIDDSWKLRKKSDISYPFTGKDFADLKHFARLFRPWGIMALWDLYISTENDFNKRTGWSIFQFTRQLPFLLDDRSWKKKAAEYQEKLAPMPKEISEILKHG